MFRTSSNDRLTPISKPFIRALTYGLSSFRVAREEILFVFALLWIALCSGNSYNCAIPCARFDTRAIYESRFRLSPVIAFNDYSFCNFRRSSLIVCFWPSRFTAINLISVEDGIKVISYQCYIQFSLYYIKMRDYRLLTFI